MSGVWLVSGCNGDELVEEILTPALVGEWGHDVHVYGDLARHFCCRASVVLQWVMKLFVAQNALV